MYIRMLARVKRKKRFTFVQMTHTERKKVIICKFNCASFLSLSLSRSLFLLLLQSKIERCQIEYSTWKCSISQHYVQAFCVLITICQIFPSAIEEEKEKESFFYLINQWQSSDISMSWYLHSRHVENDPGWLHGSYSFSLSLSAWGEVRLNETWWRLKGELNNWINTPLTGLSRSLSLSSTLDVNWLYEQEFLIREKERRIEWKTYSSHH